MIDVWPEGSSIRLEMGRKKKEKKRIKQRKLQYVFPQVFSNFHGLLPLAVCQTYFIFIYNNLITAKCEGERQRETDRTRDFSDLMKAIELLVQIDFN